MSDFVYDNAPLAEVIAEIFWTTVPISIIPGASVDPYFSQVQPKFELALREKSFIYAETLIPANVPIELLAGQVVKRYRKAEGKYPLYQIGPGVVTCNNIPPYDGWSAFRKDLAVCFDVLMDAWPEKNGPSFRCLRLRYLDAFNRANGYIDDAKFLNKDLRVGRGLDESFIEHFCDSSAEVSVAVSTRLPLRALPGSTMAVVVNRGEKDGEPAYVLDTAVEWNIGDSQAVPSVTAWFDEAHAQISEMFKRVISPDLEGTFGAKRPRK